MSCPRFTRPQSGGLCLHLPRLRSRHRRDDLLEAVRVASRQHGAVHCPALPDGHPAVHAFHHDRGVSAHLLLFARPEHGYHGHGLPDHDEEAAREQGRAMAGRQHRGVRHLGGSRAPHRLPFGQPVPPVRHPVRSELRRGRVPDHSARA